LWVLGLHGQQMGLANGCDAPHIFSAALALALTTFLMLTLKIVHPPAGATTLIVAIGLLPHAWQVPLVGVSALLLSLEARVLQRVAGQSLPWWSAQYAAPRNDDVAGDAPVDEANAA
jgi:CBS-domain-containing membrane protein